MSASEDLLRVDGIAKRFGGVQAVADASFTVARGSITALIGPNGAGKTTMFDIISGSVRPDRGTVRFAGRPVTGLATHRIAAAGLVRTFQLTRVFSGLSVLDNMLLAARDQPGEHLAGLLLRPGAARAREREARTEALRLLDLFGLADKAQTYAAALSGGQRKLLELARALMTAPTLVLLDEPMAGVNPTLGRRLLDQIEAIRKTEGRTFLFVEHDMDVVMSRADRVVVMAEGRVIAAGPPAVIRSDPRVVEAYLGAPAGASA